MRLLAVPDSDDEVSSDHDTSSRLDKDGNSIQQTVPEDDHDSLTEFGNPEQLKQDALAFKAVWASQAMVDVAAKVDGDKTDEEEEHEDRRLVAERYLGALRRWPGLMIELVLKDEIHELDTSPNSNQSFFIQRALNIVASTDQKLALKGLSSSELWCVRK